MESFDPNTPLNDRELNFISDHLSYDEFIRLNQSLCIGTQVEDLENVDASREMLNTWRSYQVPAQERKLMVRALNQSNLGNLAGMVLFDDQRHATGNAVASNLNMGMESFDPNTPLDDQELDHISDHLNYHKFITLGQSLCIGTPSVDLARQYMKNANAPREMLKTWHNNQDQAKERRLMVKALNESRLCSLADTVLFGEWWSANILDLSDFDNDNKVELLCLTVEGRCTNIRVESWPVNHHQHPPAPRYEPVVHLPQQPDILPMRIPQQTSYEITEIKLRDISNELGSEWRMVGTYLGFKSSQIEVMQEQYPVLKECIFQMLLQWRNCNGVEATKEKLKEALRRSNREDLVDFIDEADD